MNKEKLRFQPSLTPFISSIKQLKGIAPNKVAISLDEMNLAIELEGANINSMTKSIFSIESDPIGFVMHKPTTSTPHLLKPL